MRRLQALVKDETGATAVEYGLILAMVFLAMVAAVQGFATGIIEMWDYVSAQVLGT